MARIEIKKHPRGGYVGSITMRSNADERLGVAGVGDIGEDVVVTVGAVGASGADAILKAGSVLDRMTDDPIMSAILPPQAKLAIATTKKLASAAKAGLPALRSMFGSFGRKKKKKTRKVVKALARSTPSKGTALRPMRGRPAAAVVPAPAPEPYDDEYDDEYEDEVQEAPEGAEDTGTLEMEGMDGQEIDANAPDGDGEPAEDDDA